MNNCKWFQELGCILAENSQLLFEALVGRAICFWHIILLNEMIVSVLRAQNSLVKDLILRYVGKFLWIEMEIWSQREMWFWEQSIAVLFCTINAIPIFKWGAELKPTSDRLCRQNVKIQEYLLFL